MSKVTLITGLPGSGKTHLAKEIVEHTGAVLFDDITVDDIPALKEVVAAERDAVVTDPHLCNPGTLRTARGLLVDMGAEVEVICFTNEPEACYANVQRRDDGRKVNGMIRDMSTIYEVPEFAVKVLPVWRPSLSGSEV